MLLTFNKPVFEPDHINQKSFENFSKYSQGTITLIEPNHINQKEFITFEDFRLAKYSMPLVDFCRFI